MIDFRIRMPAKARRIPASSGKRYTSLGIHPTSLTPQAIDLLTTPFPSIVVVVTLKGVAPPDATKNVIAMTPRTMPSQNRTLPRKYVSLEFTNIGSGFSRTDRPFMAGMEARIQRRRLPSVG